MKTLYLDCGMGAAGDMLMSALFELSDQPVQFVEKLNALGLHGVRAQALESTKVGIRGTHMDVRIHGEAEESLDHTHSAHSHGHHHEHNHNHSQETAVKHSHSHTRAGDITRIIDGLPVSEAVQKNIRAVYALIADAESRAHGVPVSEVHFHEVGTMDAICDIAGVCMLIEELAPDKIIASPVRLGSGFVHASHGLIPVPAPATAHIIKGVPVYAGDIEAEMCTPTGAALLKHFCTDFSPMPHMAVEKVGYGMGSKDFAMPNCVRAFLGESAEAASAANGEVAELCCNLDDMTGEAVGYAAELLLERGALDVFITPIQMKKSRPAFMLTCICTLDDAPGLAKLMLEHTTTFGVREHICQRYTLDRHFERRSTKYGDISMKRGSGYGVQKQKPEYEDAAAAAARHGVPLSDVIREAEKTPE